MKTIYKLLQTILVIVSIIMIGSGCDNNDDVQSSPQDGFTVGSAFYETDNIYIAIDQFDRDNNGKADYYTFLFTNGRITDTYGDIGLGYALNYSTNITNLVKLQVFEGASNPNLTNTIVAGETYTASSILTTQLNGFAYTNYGFSTDSFISYSLQQGGANLGTENGFDFTDNPPEVIGVWHYPGTVGPQVTINSINIDTTTPANSAIDVDYTFLDTNGDTITGHYEGTLGIILD